MAETVSSHLQHGVSMWHSMWTDQFTRAEGYLRELGKAQAHGVAQMKLFADESNKLFQAWLDYGDKLAKDMQSLSIEGAKKTVELFKPQA